VGVQVSLSSPDLADLVVAIRYEHDGEVMRKDLLRGLRAAVAPGVAEAKASILSMPSSSLVRGNQPGGSMRKAIARKVGTQVSLSSQAAKVKVRVRKSGFPRGLNNAPKVYSLPGGWRHPVFDTGKWVGQVGKPEWFDGPLRSRRAQYRAAVEAAMQRTADRIARSV
jgi:hypothetical protein